MRTVKHINGRRRAGPDNLFLLRKHNVYQLWEFLTLYFVNGCRCAKVPWHSWLLGKKHKSCKHEIAPLFLIPRPWLVRKGSRFLLAKCVLCICTHLFPHVWAKLALRPHISLDAEAIFYAETASKKPFFITAHFPWFFRVGLAARTSSNLLTRLIDCLFQPLKARVVIESPNKSWLD